MIRLGPPVAWADNTSRCVFVGGVQHLDGVRG